ncbi:hypothetical protein [Mycobacteroides franklinii]|nr:hypothetical protein [Mycobacteroides franklinii]
MTYDNAAGELSATSDATIAVGQSEHRSVREWLTDNLFDQYQAGVGH